MMFIETVEDLKLFVHHHKSAIVTISLCAFIFMWIIIELCNAPTMPEDYEEEEE